MNVQKTQKIGQKYVPPVRKDCIKRPNLDHSVCLLRINIGIIMKNDVRSYLLKFSTWHDVSKAQNFA